MDTQAIFQFIADNPPAAMIVGGILLIVMSVITGTIDTGTTDFLRNTGVWLIAGGFLLQVLWLVLRRH
jgi:hypothetical protein